MSKTLNEEALAVYESLRTEVDALLDGFNYLQAMGDILHKDIQECVAMAKGKEEHSSASRATVRAIFAYLEGIVFCMKRLALILSPRKGNFSTAELAMLEESSYDLDDKGKILIQQKFIPFTKNIKFAFDACARVFKVRFELDVGDAGWGSFQYSLQVRNRITHPRTVEDLHISEKDTEELQKALGWFSSQFESLIEKFKETIQEMDKVLSEAKAKVTDKKASLA